jgi:hypothetical protein
MEVLLGIPSVGLGDGATTHEHGKRYVGIVPQKEPYFSPPVQWTKHREVEDGINSTPRSDEDVHTAQSHHFHARALL